ncbi:hypothetical protein ACN42_g5175 [Penicillium freii]|uniref:Uncharacterized protein n=1 Tax=Penicillium freii TaxID=48697 RepID=A0A124GRP3_PENFR|nr:hypothetical protein ACN42_g5175 [Penicillium freii]
MASNQRFQQTVQAVAEAVQIFVAGTFGFAESIKQIWGPQIQPDAVETSNHLPVEGRQDVQVADQLRDRIPASQDGDQLATNSRSHPPSMTLHDEEGALEVPHEAIIPLDTTNMQLSNDMDAVSKSLLDAVRSCYECFARWQDESPFPPCLPTLVGPCDYCTRMKILSQNGDAPIKNERFERSVYETSEPLEMPLSSPIVDVPQQQVGSKRVYHCIEEQQPMFKRQRIQELRRGLGRKVYGGERVLRQEQDYHATAAENRESSSSSVSFSSSEKEASQIKMAMNTQESSPIKTSDMLPVTYKVTSKDVTHLDGENYASSSFTQKESLEDSSSEEDEDDYSSSEEEAVQMPAAKEVSQEEHNSKELIQLSDDRSSNSSSEDESSDEESEDEPEEQQLRHQLAL